MKIVLRWMILCLIFITESVFAWNAVGHKLVAQIAWDNLSQASKSRLDSLNHAMDLVYPAQSFVNASVWLDNIRYQDIKWYDRMHYVNWPFTKDDSPLPIIESVNALWAMDNALATLKGKYAKPFDKGLALRILIHVTADIHQPLHATTLVSAEHPKGDLGGNLYPVHAGKAGNNLHAYWDKGGGLLVVKDKSDAAIQTMADDIAKHWPCDGIQTHLTPAQWLEESHYIGINKAYQLPEGAVPDAQYQSEAQTISEQRIAQAGCRLAALLNNPYLKRGKH